MGLKLTNENENYCATIVKIHKLNDLVGLDNLKGVSVFGYNALVDKTYQVGGLYVLFVAESQLSDDFVKNNNLYRKSDLNKSTDKTGYIEENRRVRAIKLRGNISSALLMPVSCLSYLGFDTYLLKEGDTFTHINGTEVCRKYVIKTYTPSTPKEKGRKKKEFMETVDSKLFPEHMDTSHYLRNEHLINDDDVVICTQKLHGCSARFAHQVYNDKPTILRKLLKFFGFKDHTMKFGLFAGSRRVVKYVNKKQAHYYKEDIWNKCLVDIQHTIPKNFIIYGEIIGWAGESGIQNYKYNLPKGEYRFYVYRISIVNPDGVSVDLSWDNVKEFCKDRGLLFVPELWRGKKRDFDYTKYMDVKFVQDLGLDCVKVDDTMDTDEGICIRVEGLTPKIYKCKSPKFLTHETKQLDADVLILD